MLYARLNDDFIIIKKNFPLTIGLLLLDPQYQYYLLAKRRVGPTHAFIRPRPTKRHRLLWATPLSLMMKSTWSLNQKINPTTLDSLWIGNRHIMPGNKWNRSTWDLFRNTAGVNVSFMCCILLYITLCSLVLNLHNNMQCVNSLRSCGFTRTSQIIRGLIPVSRTQRWNAGSDWSEITLTSGDASLLIFMN